MKEPVDHIARPRLPWRSPEQPALTECGHDVAAVKVITRAEFVARVKEMGRQRAALFTCMTCSQTVDRWTTWEEDPRSAVAREAAWECGWAKDRGHLLKDELLALAALVAAHPDEFRALIADLEARRQWLERKEPAAKPKKPTIIHW